MSSTVPSSSSRRSCSRCSYMSVSFAPRRFQDTSLSRGCTFPPPATTTDRGLANEHVLCAPAVSRPPVVRRDGATPVCGPSRLARVARRNASTLCAVALKPRRTGALRLAIRCGTCDKSADRPCGQGAGHLSTPQRRRISDRPAPHGLRPGFIVVVRSAVLSHSPDSSVPAEQTQPR